MAPASEALAGELRRVGGDAGLDAMGFAAAEVFEETRGHIEQRRRDGLAGGMQFTYRNPRRSTDPRRALPGARSLVVGARRYMRREPAGGGAPDREPADRAPADRAPALGDARAVPVPARVARYSWSDHYQPLRRALGQVAARLERHGYRAAVLVDDNALVDREAARRAGLGWYGKNTNLLLPGAGSWFVLGSVLTDADLPPATPVQGGCGTCQRCLPACPTGALSAPGVLDARRCLAWLVQAPGVFPAEHRVALGDRLYGCDDCQEVCPVNLRAARRRPPPEAEPGSEAVVDALELLEAGDEDLLARYGRWYIPHRQPRYLRRNALLVMANTGDPEDPGVMAALGAALADPDGLIRAHAVWAAARLGQRHLLAPLAGDRDPLVREELAGVDGVPVRRPGAARVAGSGRSSRDRRRTVRPFPRT